MSPRARLILAGVATVAALATRGGQADAGGSTVVKGPYLQRLASTSVEVRVELSTPSAATVDFEPSTGARRTVDDPVSNTFHVFHVTGLAPDQHYRYRVHAGKATSDTGDFVTAPADDSSHPFTFVLYGDNRTDGPTHAAVVRDIQQESFDFLVHTGDFVAMGGEAPLWQDFFDIERTLLRDHCVFACVGNHELFEDSQAANFERYFGPGPTDAGDIRLYSSFRWGNARFFLLNAFQDWDGDERGWLERELASADTEAGLAWRFAVIHHSPWSAGPHGNNARLLAAGIDTLLVTHHVDAVLAGHDHIYERGEAKGLKYIVSGGGGAPLYRDLTPKPSTRKAEPSYHYVLFGVSADRVTITSKRIDGSLIEQCGFGHGTSWDCDAKPPSQTTPPPVADPATPSRSTRCGCLVPGRGTAQTPAASLVAAVALLCAVRRRRRG
jgi:acid phosphatase type 7